MEYQDPLCTISENYKMIEFLGQGVYGHVIKCLKQDTEETVAVKVLKKRHPEVEITREVAILEKLRSLDPDKSNIVKYHEWFHKLNQTFMVFEILDMSLFDFMCRRRWAPLPFNGIRTVVKDVATALNALKEVGLIHTDIKLDNIMLVDHQQQPFRVRLIDFGLTLHRTEAKPGQNVQPLCHKSPEILFGIQFTEAIDIWSLGSVMAEMLLGFLLFPGRNEYDVLRFIIDMLGEPPKRLLNTGINTSLFYHKSRKCGLFKQWTFKTPVEFYTETGIKPEETRRWKFSSLDEMKILNLHQENSEEAADRSACVELLREMLQMDPRNRITPSKVLAHPFITGSHLSPSSSAHVWDVQEKMTDSLSVRYQEETLKLESITDSVSPPSPPVDHDIVSTLLVAPNSHAEAPNGINHLHTPEAQEVN